jgi:hypothetical protein
MQEGFHEQDCVSQGHHWFASVFLRWLVVEGQYYRLLMVFL